ncbi:MAG: bifunctional salicylyl-CoA 5-hydroxylase/oxidoreductase [Bdellovibrionota bacterium]|nr:MAG: bifunctional salicylyl-CoA 5-hydroxylase/oxidoreductase [Bdellovibrionota bacterium]
MRIVCIGGGPAGLYFSILMKLADPESVIDVYERNPRGSTFGWGVVFSDATLNNFLAADPETCSQIRDTLAHWDDIEVHFKGGVVRSSGHGFCGIARIRLLQILENRAESLGIRLHFGTPVDDEDFPNADLIVASDGIFSRTREKYSQFFKPDLEKRICRYTWLGTKKVFDAFTFFFKETEHGWFQAHCYRFDNELSTFLVECPEEVWKKAGIDKMGKAESIAFCEQLFADHLDGARLIANSDHLVGSAAWINFVRVRSEQWFYKNIVLLGDAAATAHFSIGSGTKLAMESAIALVHCLREESSLEKAFTRYQEQRSVEVLKLQSAARNSTDWFENVALRSQLPKEQFAYSLLTRSQRVSHENLRLRDRAYLEGYETWLAKHLTGACFEKPRAPMFLPCSLRSMQLTNRIVVSPMAMYSAVEGTPGEFHLVHFGSLALGGAGLIFTEMTNVSADARITPGCAGLYNETHLAAWKRIVDFVHSHSPAKIGLQLGHAGPKGSTRLAWEGMDLPLEEDSWEIIAPSAIPYTPKSRVPREMTRMDMERVRDDFVRSTMLGIRCGFDMLELHCAHGYLLSSFISPLTNKRSDEYGGSLENRLRFPLEIFRAMRAVWPQEKPISVRISAHDWVPGGTDLAAAVEIAAHFKEAGADLIDVSSGQVSIQQKPVYGRMYQTPFAERIRLEVGLKTMAVGSIFEADHANSIIAAGRADLCLLARPHLADPHWTQRAAAELRYAEQWWPPQYLSAKGQFEANIQRAKEAAAL